MEFFNEFHEEEFSKEDLEKLLICSAPIFPHLVEEIWEKTGHDYSIHMQEWPKIEESDLFDETVEIPVQINGKVRGRLVVESGSTQEDIKQKVLLEKAFLPYLEGKEIKKLIYVQDKIVNVVV